MSDERKNDQLKDSEKDMRKFTLSLVFIIIIGTSAIFFMLQYRSAKRSVAEIQNGQETLKPASLKPSMGERKLMKQVLKGPDSRAPSAGASQFKKLRGVNSHKMGKRNSRNLQFFSRQQFQLSDKVISLGRRGKFEVILDYVAVDDEFRDRFDASDILGEKFGRLLVKEGEAKGIKNQQLVRNSKTGQVGIVTGIIVVTFNSESDFQDRDAFLPGAFREDRIFAGIHTAIWYGEQVSGIDELRSLQVGLLEDQRIKRVTIEILEQGRVTK